ncbi:MAG: DUF4363 family protein [Clostridia bacterium]|nr:DUF4363 family protein [Clostridia bacterium]MBQ9861047.1 DUF4363 family protein [Clostridia bacterium]
MKRVLVAVVLLLLVCIGCAVSITLQHAVLEEFMTKTEQMEELFKRGDVAGAVAAAESFTADYTDKTRVFSLFLPHTMLTEVEKSVVSLPAILTHGEHKDFVAEVHRCRLLLQKMHDLEMPTLQNIL